MEDQQINPPPDDPRETVKTYLASEEGKKLMMELIDDDTIKHMIDAKPSLKDSLIGKGIETFKTKTMPNLIDEAVKREKMTLEERISRIKLEIAGGNKKIAGLLQGSTEEEIAAYYQNLQEMIAEQAAQQDAERIESFKKAGKTEPEGKKKSEGISLAEFEKMNSTERTKLFESHPDQYNRLKDALIKRKRGY